MKKPNQGRTSWVVVLNQALLGFCLFVGFVLPYLRRAHGLQGLRRQQRYLFVVNHVSLLDSILLGGLCWRCGCYPILVLGDRAVWHASWIRRLVSGCTAFLLDRGRLNPGRIRELQAFGRAGEQFNLVVYPEGTRGNGVDVAPFQPGLFYIAQEAQLPIVPVFIHNMQLVSSKTGEFHPIAGLRKVEVQFGEPIAAADYLPQSKEEFTGFIRRSLMALQLKNRVPSLSRPEFPAEAAAYVPPDRQPESEAT